MWRLTRTFTIIIEPKHENMTMNTKQWCPVVAGIMTTFINDIFRSITFHNSATQTRYPCMRYVFLKLVNYDSLSIPSLRNNDTSEM